MNYGCRKCRREGEKLLLKGDRCFSPKCSITRRSYAPGQHGISMSKKMSEYGRQLREKQRLKKIYGISEVQLSRCFKKAEKSQQNSTERLISLLELRLDNVIYRARMADSRSQAKQLISHGKVLVNDKKASIPSIVLAPKDKITFNKKITTEKLSSQNIVWFKCDPKSGLIEIKSVPSRAEIDLNVNENLVVEFYSR